MLPWKGFGSRAGFSHPGSGNMAQYFEKGNNFLLTIYDIQYMKVSCKRGTWILDPDPVLQRGVFIETLQEAKCSLLFTLSLWCIWNVDGHIWEKWTYYCENYIAPWSTFIFLNIMFFYLSINKFINKYLRLFALFSYLLRFLFDFPLRLFSRP